MHIKKDNRNDSVILDHVRNFIKTSFEIYKKSMIGISKFMLLDEGSA